MLLDQRMFGRQHHVGGAEQRVGPGGEDADCRVAAVGFAVLRTVAKQGKIDLRAFALADPVALHLLDRFGPIDQFQIVEQAVGIGGDAQQPLPQRHADDGMAATFGFAVDDFFVGQHGAQRFAPVDRHLGLVSEAFAVLIFADGELALGLDFGRNRQLADGPALLRGRRRTRCRRAAGRSTASI